MGNWHFKVCGDRANVVYFEMRNKLTFDTKKILVAHKKEKDTVSLMLELSPCITSPQVYVHSLLHILDTFLFYDYMFEKSKSSRISQVHSFPFQWSAISVKKASVSDATNSTLFSTSFKSQSVKWVWFIYVSSSMSYHQSLKFRVFFPFSRFVCYK